MDKSEKKVYEDTLEMFYGCCAMCGSSNIHMHHIRYGACGRYTYMGNVIPLCKKHHDLVHSNKKKYQPMLIDLINKVLQKNNIMV